MNSLINELEWRGYIHDITPQIDNQLNNESTSIYIGIDPTSDSLHIGNLSTLILLKHFQLVGHKPIIVLGGATGMIGDPSGKSKERNLLDKNVINDNINKISNQLHNLFDFNFQKSNKAEIINNYDWIKDYTFLQFLRDIGKHISINYMLSKDSIKSRLNRGISFSEFSYQLLQAYDFYYLYKHKNVKIQVGGSDQWGNITTGIELIRRINGDNVFGLTSPLVTKSNGEKFGKTEDGNIWINSNKTSIYDFYQYWINCSDEDSKSLIKLFTFLSKEKIEELIKEHEEAPNLRTLQRTIAEEVTTLVHGIDFSKRIKQQSEALFSININNEQDLLEASKKLPLMYITKDEYKNSRNYLELLNLLDRYNIFSSNSNSEIKRKINSGCIRINKEKIHNYNQSVNYVLLFDKYLLIQIGKKNYYLFHVR